MVVIRPRRMPNESCSTLARGAGGGGGGGGAADGEGVVQHLGEGGETVGGARGVGDDRVLGRVVGAVVHTHADGQVRRLGGRGDDHLPRTRLEVLGGLVALGEEAAALED